MTPIPNRWQGAVGAASAATLLLAAAAWAYHGGFAAAGADASGPSPGFYALVAAGAAAAAWAVASALRAATWGEPASTAGTTAHAFRISPKAMVITDLHTGQIEEMSETFEKLSGFSREEMIGALPADLGILPGLQDRQDYIRSLLATGRVRDLPMQVRDRSGKTGEVRLNMDLFSSGGTFHILAVVNDVTEYNHSEAGWMANEDRFQSFIKNASVGIYRSTPDGKIIMANQALIKIMGYDSLKDLMARNLEMGGYEPSYPRAEFKEKLEAEGTISGFEAAWKRRDGSTIFVRESASLIRGQDGTPLYYDGIIEDISERKRAEQALRESEDRFRQLAAAAFEGVFITENGRIIEVNDQGLKMIGRERSEVIGRPVLDLVAPESRHIVSVNMRSGRELVYEHQMLRRDGTLFWAEAQAKMVHQGGRLLRMTALRDITERLQNEKRQQYLEEQLRQTQKMEALGTLAGGIAHDFNNILTGILGNLQLAEMDTAPGHPSLEALGAASQACRRARDLVSRILSFSRLEQENRTPSALGPTVLEAVQLLRVGLPPEIEIRTRIAEDCPPVVFDSSQMHQVIMNLGTNSIHAMRGQGGLLELELRSGVPGAALRERNPQVSTAHTVCLRVRDTGCGMDKEVLKHLFEPFYTTKMVGQGTGLGLAMVHTIMKSHKGAIVIESAPGSGTVFELYLPAAKQAQAPQAPAALRARADELEPFGRGRRILLVDDEDTVRNTGTSLIKRLGFVPVAFAQPALALKAFQSEPGAFFAVITDLTMPEMSGLELANRVLEARPATPIILISGYLQSDSERRAVQIGIRRIISKPFEVLDLMNHIRALDAEAVEPSPG